MWNKENSTLLLIMMQSFEFVCWDWPCSVGISWTLVVCVGKPWIHWTFNSIPIPAISKLWQGRSWNCKTRIEASPKCKTSPCVRVHTCVTWIWAGVGVPPDGQWRSSVMARNDWWYGSISNALICVSSFKCCRSSQKCWNTPPCVKLTRFRSAPTLTYLCFNVYRIIYHFYHLSYDWTRKCLF